MILGLCSWKRNRAKAVSGRDPTRPDERGGSGQGGEGPFRRLATDRTSRSPAWRIPNRSDGSGRRWATAARATVCKREAGRASGFASADYPLHVQFDLALRASRAARRRFTTMRQFGPKPASWRRKVSRTRRRMRLRAVALPKAFGVVNPIFGPSGAPVERQKATKHELGTLAPWS